MFVNVSVDTYANLRVDVLMWTCVYVDVCVICPRICMCGVSHVFVICWNFTKSSIAGVGNTQVV